MDELTKHRLQKPQPKTGQHTLNRFHVESKQTKWSCGDRVECMPKQDKRHTANKNGKREDEKVSSLIPSNYS